MQPTAIVPGGPEDQPPAGRADTAAAAPWGTALTTLAVAAALVAATTMLQGQWSERWVKRDVAASLTRDAVILERVFPTRFGDWEMEIELESDPKEMQAAGAVGHVSRVFRNVRSGARVSAFVVCATPYDASIHTPDRCYPGAGFEVAESEHRQTVPLADGRAGETWTGTFQKKEQTIRVFWTYGGHGQWLAPQIADRSRRHGRRLQALRSRRRVAEDGRPGDGPGRRFPVRAVAQTRRGRGGRPGGREPRGRRG